MLTLLPVSVYVVILEQKSQKAEDRLEHCSIAFGGLNTAQNEMFALNLCI